MGMDDDVNTSARSVADKVMALLHALGTAEHPVRLAELSEVSDTSKGTCRRLLLDLCSQGYAHSPARGLYLAGPQLQGLAAAVVRNDPLGGVSADSLDALARATGHLAARVSVADGRAVVLGVENPQRLPLALQVGDQLPAHPLWSEGATTDDGPVEEYPSGSTWTLAAPTDEQGTTFLVLVGFTFMRPQDETAAQLLAGHARALGEAMTGLRDAG
ncbi:hypothetical protein GCM10009626_09260 [Brachybacterium sacelli]